jgi:hypothetical protein
LLRGQLCAGDLPGVLGPAVCRDRAELQLEGLLRWCL